MTGQALGRPRSELLAERAKLATWVDNLQTTPQFGARYCIWLIDKAREALAEQDNELARLRALTAMPVLYVTEQHARQAMDASMGEAPGTILRCTDTGREWVLRDGSWQDQDQGE